MREQTIGFIGSGQMARALASGFVQAGLVKGNQICYHDPISSAVTEFAEIVPGARGLATNAEVAQGAGLLILAVKPQQMATVLGDIKQSLAHDPLVVSIAAGVKLATLQGTLGDRRRLVRVMPNTPCLVGQSASGYCLSEATTEQDEKRISSLLQAVGVAIRVEEKLLDAVTGLSGSGPAFVYLMIEALSDGGVRMGLPRDVAQLLAAQTVLGAAQMVLSSGEHPAVLKDRVTSPGGTTIAGLHVLEAGGLRGLLIGAVEAASQRARELSGV